MAGNDLKDELGLKTTVPENKSGWDLKTPSRPPGELQRPRPRRRVGTNVAGDRESPGEHLWVCAEQGASRGGRKPTAWNTDLEEVLQRCPLMGSHSWQAHARGCRTDLFRVWSPRPVPHTLTDKEVSLSLLTLAFVRGPARSFPSTPSLRACGLLPRTPNLPCALLQPAPPSGPQIPVGGTAVQPESLPSFRALPLPSPCAQSVSRLISPPSLSLLLSFPCHCLRFGPHLRPRLLLQPPAWPPGAHQSPRITPAPWLPVLASVTIS